MDILSNIEERRAYRALSEKPIGRDILDRLAMAAHLAPSSANNQPWRMVTVTEPARLKELRKCLSQGNYWARKAPAITAFCASADWSMKMDQGRELAWFELGMAAMNYQLQAVQEGLHVHPIVGFNAGLAKQVLGIPESVTLEILMILAYPGSADGLNEKHLAAESAPRSRKPLESVYASDAWDDRLLPPPKV